MRRRLWILSILALLIISAQSPAKSKLVRFTVSNTASINVALRLDSRSDDTVYYFKIKASRAGQPRKTVYTIERDTYNMTVYYLEAYDPVYGYPQCGGQTRSANLDATRQVSYEVPECGRQGMHPRRTSGGMGSTGLFP